MFVRQRILMRSMVVTWIHQKKKTNGDEYNFELYYPSSIKEAYAEGNGVYPDSGNPFWWYLETYYEYSMDDAFSKAEEILEKLFTEEGDMEKMPNPKDVTGRWSANYSK